MFLVCKQHKHSNILWETKLEKIMENKEKVHSNLEENPQDLKTKAHTIVHTLELRAKVREYTKLHRDRVRTNILDSLRLGVGEIKGRINELDNLTENDVAGLANRIKHNKRATNDDMYRLSHAFLADGNNIETFCKITGAMQVLVKELTGNDSERRLSSAECLCNLSLGEAPVCERIASLAGSYLVTYLHSTENHLIRMCLWIITNILATSCKGALILMKMQLFSKLWNLYTNDSVAEDVADFREDAAICLQIIALNSKLLVKSHDREFVIQHLAEKNPTCTAGEFHLQLIFYIIFSEIEVVTYFSSDQQLYLINYSLSNMCKTKEFKTASQRLRIIFSIRVLGNLINRHPSCYSMLLQQISLIWQTNLLTIFNTLFAFKDPYLTRELLWILNNILKLENLSGPFISENSFLCKLRIPKADFFSFENSDI